MWQLCGQDRVDISLTVHSCAILKVVKSMCNGINSYLLYSMSQLWGISEIFLDATQNTNSAYRLKGS
jgi:hypothetical protein